jgi:hypothetical protein
MEGGVTVRVADQTPWLIGKDETAEMKRATGLEPVGVEPDGHPDASGLDGRGRPRRGVGRRRTRAEGRVDERQVLG